MKNKQNDRAKKRPAKIKEEAVNHFFGLLETLRGEADDSLIEELQRHFFTLTNSFSSNYCNWAKRLRDRHITSTNDLAGGD